MNAITRPDHDRTHSTKTDRLAAMAPTTRDDNPTSVSSAALERDFEAQCLPYRGELFAAAIRMTRHADDAHDLVQETFLRAYAAWPRFQHGTNVRAWLFRILSNTFINIYRKRRRHRRFEKERPGEAVAVFYGDRQAHTGTPEEMLLHGTLGDEVTAALDSLDDSYRTVVEMADLEGIRYRDIASRLRVPMGTVMSRLFRARRKLEKALGGFAAAHYGISRAA